jgi:hypothetical protein
VGFVVNKVGKLADHATPTTGGTSVILVNLKRSDERNPVLVENYIK